ncbi:MAG: S8 family serine peptidase [Bdellovibrionota bacterium]
MNVFKHLVVGALALSGFASIEAQAVMAKNPILKSAKKHSREMAPEAVPGEFVVKMRVSGLSTLSQSVKTLAQFGLQVKQVVNADENVVLVKSTKPELMSLGSNSATRMMSQVRDFGNVEFIEPNFVYHAFDLPESLPNDPDFNRLWAMKNNGQADKSGRAGIVGADIHAPEAWAISTGSKDVVVAIIDTGIDYTHPDLQANVWSAPDNANVHGYNAITDKLDPMDDHSHGTHCFGTIAGSGDNGVGVAGVTWHASVMGVKFLTGAGSGTLADAVKAIDWATAHGAQIMSNSWGGGGYSQALFDAIKRAQDKNILFIAAAGNDSSDNDANPSYPASYQLDNVISVAASNNVDALAYFSNYGATTVHLAAPGENIYSTIPTALSKGGVAYDTYSGTSMATPHVSGAAALLLAKEPSLTYAQVKARLMDSTDKSRTFRGKLASMGRLNIYNLLAGITGPGPVIPPEGSWSSPVARLVESAHPYLDNSNVSVTLEQPGANFIRVHFTRVDLESGYDFLKLIAANGEVADQVTGRKTAGFWSNEVQGSKITLQLTSDDSVNSWGFAIDSYEWTNFNGQTETVQVQAR